MLANAQIQPPGNGSAAIPYQGHLERDGVAEDGAHDLLFELYSDDSGAGTLLFSEVQGPVPVLAGSFSVLLGTGSPSTASAV